MQNHREAPPIGLMSIEEAAAASGIDVDVVHHLIALRIIRSPRKAADGEDILPMDQLPLIEILAAMDVMNFRIEEMRDMVRVVDLLSSMPASELASRYRIRLGLFVQALERRPVVTAAQIDAKHALQSVLKSRYAWLMA